MGNFRNGVQLLGVFLSKRALDAPLLAAGFFSFSRCGCREIVTGSLRSAILCLEILFQACAISPPIRLPRYGS